MDPLESLLRPVTRILNRNISESTPARELCAGLDGKTVAVRVRDSALAMYFEFDAENVVLKPDSEAEPDVVLTGSLLTLARLAASGDDGPGSAAIRDGGIELTGDAYTAQSFQELLRYAKPDVEEELSHIIGDVAAHRVGQLARGLRGWASEARSTMGSNLREYLQEESRDVPSRYEVEVFTRDVATLRDDVARLEARIKRMMDA